MDPILCVDRMSPCLIRSDHLRKFDCCTLQCSFGNYAIRMCMGAWFPPLKARARLYRPCLTPNSPNLLSVDGTRFGRHPGASRRLGGGSACEELLPKNAEEGVGVSRSSTARLTPLCGANHHPGSGSQWSILGPGFEKTDPVEGRSVLATAEGSSGPNLDAAHPGDEFLPATQLLTFRGQRLGPSETLQQTGLLDGYDPQSPPRLKLARVSTAPCSPA